jgi:hypothetical protein
MYAVFCSILRLDDVVSDEEEDEDDDDDKESNDDGRRRLCGWFHNDEHPSPPS